MRLDVALLGFAFSAVSTIVVVIGGLAALQQLRYLRHGNELSTLTDLWAQFDSDVMRSAREFVRVELREAMRDPAFLRELRAIPQGPRAQHVAHVANFFEIIGIYVHTGALSERLVMLIWGNVLARNWDLTREAIAITRAGQGNVLDFFEDLAMRAPRWIGGDKSRAIRSRLLKDPDMPAAAQGLPVEEP